MKKTTILFVFGIMIFSLSQKFVFSDDLTIQRDLARDVNDYATEKLGLSLEEISLLFSFNRNEYISPEVIDDYINREYMSRLLEEKYITLETAPDLGNDIPGGNEFYYFELTEKSKVIVGQGK